MRDSVVTFTERTPAGLLLIRALETKSRDISTRAFDCSIEWSAVGDNFPQSLIGIDTRAVLVDIAELDLLH